MDNQDINIDKYIEKLPNEVKDFIQSDEWQKRIKEIAEKYSLTETQTESITNNSLLFLIGILSPEDFESSIKEDKTLSPITSEQIVDDIGKRVFDYALKIFETNKPKEIRQEKTSIPKMIYPEVKPNNLPSQTNSANEKVSVPKYAPIGQGGYKPAGTTQNPIEKPKVEFKPPQSTAPEMKKETPSVLDPIPSQFGKIAYKPEGKNEMVQAPKSVPQFNLNKEISEKLSTSPEMPKVSSIIDNKLKNITSSIKDTVEEKITDTTPAAPSTPITKQYSVDPYREPLA